MDSLGLSCWEGGSYESQILSTFYVYLTVTARCYWARVCRKTRLLVEAAPVWDLSGMTTSPPEALREQAMGPVGMVTVSSVVLREHALGPFVTMTVSSVVLRVLVSERGWEYRPSS